MSVLQFEFQGKQYFPHYRRSTYFLDYPCETPHQCSPIETILPPGSYLLELWGAQGGNASLFNDFREGGFGGFSSGILRLNTHTKAFFYIGGSGIQDDNSTERTTGTSFNGGGSGRTDAGYRLATSGGGGTDVRLVENSIYHRVIVAGGGGGSNTAYSKCYGGHGGGETGTNATQCHIEAANSTSGTQTEGGITKYPATIMQSNGTFGYGGNAWEKGDGCGGGGGWFGGGAGSGYISAGSGGSGYIFNETNYETALSVGLKLSTKFFLEKGYMIQGNETMPSPNPYVDEEIGHRGNGAILITPLSFHFINSCFNNRKLYNLLLVNTFIFLS